MIDYLSKEQVAAMLTASDRPVSSLRVYAWVSTGLKVGKRRVYLKAIRLPRGMAFLEEHVREFLAELNGTTPEAVAPRPSLPMRFRGGIRKCADDEIGTFEPALRKHSVPVVRSTA